jgi:hypothetical protein
VRAAVGDVQEDADARLLWIARDTPAPAGTVTVVSAGTAAGGSRADQRRPRRAAAAGAGDARAARGAPLEGVEAEGELVTPTGAALAAALAEGRFGSMRPGVVAAWVGVRARGVGRSSTPSAGGNRMHSRTNQRATRSFALQDTHAVHSGAQRPSADRNVR